MSKQTYRFFMYEDQLYTWAVPVKMLFRSTMVHDVVTRGDIFAVRISDRALTVIPGGRTIYPVELELDVPEQLSASIADNQSGQERIVHLSPRETSSLWKLTGGRDIPL